MDTRRCEDPSCTRVIHDDMTKKCISSKINDDFPKFLTTARIFSWVPYVIWWERNLLEGEEIPDERDSEVFAMQNNGGVEDGR